MHTCANCHIGTLQRRRGAYAAWHGDQFVVISGTPLWACDVCGEWTYDMNVLDQLLPLIGLPTSPGQAAGPAGRQHGADAPPPFAIDRTRRRV